MKKIILILIMMGAYHANAGNINVKYGLGDDSLSPTVAQRILEVGYDDALAPGFIYRVAGGVYWDNTRALTSGFGFLSFGPRIRPVHFFYLENLIGVGAISKTDDLLGSHLQFSIDFGIGFTMADNASIGITYKHLSNAGIKAGPNQGRNFWLMSLRMNL